MGGGIALHGFEGLGLERLVAVDHEVLEFEEVVGEEELIENLLILGGEAPVEELGELLVVEADLLHHAVEKGGDHFLEFLGEGQVRCGWWCTRTCSPPRCRILRSGNRQSRGY